MEITTFTFILFLAVSLIFYWGVPKGYQWVVLLIDSLIFYFFNAYAFTVVYLLASVLSVWFATSLFKKVDDIKRKRIFIITLFFNFGILSLLKYTNLAIGIINPLISSISGKSINSVSWVSSLGISFYTLQLTSYLCDTYWGIISIETNPIKLFLFTAFFPNILSGPINRYKDLGHQLFDEHRFDYDTVTHGMKRIALGYLKKMVVSARLATVVEILWNDTDTYHGLWIWITMVIYVFQLYTDFSGCMDIMLGASECFGIKLAENFNAPFFSKTIQEFWQRWHITLGQWLRDYIMNPILKSEKMIKLGEKSKALLGKKKGKKVTAYVSMLVLWVCMGLWHGDNVKYIIGEGLYFWLIIVLSDALGGYFKKLKLIMKVNEGRLWDAFRMIRTYVIFSIGMIFFKADSINDAFFRIECAHGVGLNMMSIVSIINDSIGVIGLKGIIYAFFSFFIILLCDIGMYQNVDLLYETKKMNSLFRWGIYCVIIAIICLSYDYSGEVFAYAHF